MKVVLITGASSGIGFETAKRLAVQGHKVYGAARRTDRLEALRKFGATPLRMDITEESSIKTAVDEILKAEGRIDVLVNNAGYGYFGAIENVSLEEARAQMEVNVFGLAALTKLVLPVMREQGCGTIVNLSSVAGRMVFCFGGWYHVSKYAVEAFSDALRIEMKPFGVNVAMIEPGGVKTNWGIIAADHLVESSAGTAYEKAALNEAAIMRKGYTGDYLASPDKVARSICRAVNARRPRARYHVGTGGHALLILKAVLPTRWMDALMRLGCRCIRVKQSK